MDDLNKKRPIWKKHCDEIQFLGQVRYHGVLGACTEAALDSMVHDISNYVCVFSSTAPFFFVRQADFTMEMCFFPIEIHEEEWIKNIEKIRSVLSRSKEWLNRVAPPDYHKGVRTPYEEHLWFNPVEYAQKLNVYYSVLYMYSGEKKKLEKQLNRVLEDTVRNVSHLLYCEDAVEYAKQDDPTEHHKVGSDVAAPLNWLCREFLPDIDACKRLAKVYEQYCEFLDKPDHCLYEHTAAKAYLGANAEKHLARVCNLIESYNSETNIGEAARLSNEKLLEGIRKRSADRNCRRQDEIDHGGYESLG